MLASGLQRSEKCYARDPNWAKLALSLLTNNWHTSVELCDPETPDRAYRLRNFVSTCRRTANFFVVLYICVRYRPPSNDEHRESAKVPFLSESSSEQGKQINSWDKPKRDVASHGSEFDEATLLVVLGPNFGGEGVKISAY